MHQHQPLAIGLVCFAAAVCAAAPPAFAAQGVGGYPAKPIRMLMPNAPGTGTDTLGRIVAQYLGEELGQPLVVDNRAGAGGTLGMNIGRNSAPAKTPASILDHIHKALMATMARPEGGLSDVPEA